MDIFWTLFLSTVINYINRQTLSVLAPTITREPDLLRFSNRLCVTWLAGGIFLDRVGTRLGLALAVAWWSLISVLTSFANSVLSFGIFRFLLGVGEGCNWPGASKAVSEWFPVEELLPGPSPQNLTQGSKVRSHRPYDPIRSSG